MTVGATFLAGAKSRLLPASIPFRFFASATVFHVLMWVALLAGADQVTNFRGGPGPALAAIHLLTLGVLTSTAIGASVQLLPVATRRPLAAVWPIKLVFWLTVPGIAGMTAGMYAAQMTLLLLAAIVTVAGLLVFAGLLADNLRRAGSLAVVAAYGVAALIALILFTGLGLVLALDYEFGARFDHGAIALAHMVLGGFGFMGLLALGFSHVLVPMFALAPSTARRPSFVGFALAATAVALGTAGALVDSLAILTSALLIGLCAAGAHLWLMQRALEAGMRKRLGLSFLLIRASWIMLPVTLLVGLAALHGLAGPNGPTLFGFMLLGGWLLTFLLGVLQRIAPFLASMHASRSASAPMVSERVSSGPLRLHAACHGLALAALALSVTIDAGWLARLGGGIGLVGALAFAWFIAGVIRWVASGSRP